MTDDEYLVIFYSFSFFGPIRTKLLLNYFKTAKKIWTSSLEELEATGLKSVIVERFGYYRNQFDPVKYFLDLKKHGIKYLTFWNKKYPVNLKDLDDSPCVLYLKGNLKIRDCKAISIVGSRKMTLYGKKVTEDFSGELARKGITIVSGLARGVDTQAHLSALKAGGRTIAVLACGLDRVYPPENLRLAKKIEENGALISEYPIGFPPLKYHFVERNRIISGLGKVVLVVEGEKKSGTLLTASHAANQGKSVFAIPGPITSPLSAAPHFLIQNGARIAFSPEDILEELDL